MMGNIFLLGSAGLQAGVSRATVLLSTMQAIRDGLHGGGKAGIACSRR